MIKYSKNFTVSRLFVFLISLFYSVNAYAEVSQWHDLGGGRVRMVSVFDPAKGIVEGIIDVELLPGWTTYWRNPGEAGIPPEFDFSKSKGIVVEAPKYPLPVAKETSGIISIGYVDHVAFPFKANPVISPLSGELQVNLLLGVCEIICIPAVATIKQDLSTLNKSDPASNLLVKQAKQRLPVKISELHANSDNWPRVINVKKQSQSQLIIEAFLPQDFKTPTLFTEGKSSWFFDPAKLLVREGNLATFKLSLDALPENADILSTALRFTLSDGNRGSEVTMRVSK